MKKQAFKFVLLRAFAHQLQNFADFVLAYTEKEEHIDPEGDSTNQDADEMAASWLTTIEADQPPAHWLERVQQGQKLEQRGSPRQQAPRNLPNQPVDIPEHNSELLPAEIADMPPLAKKHRVRQSSLRPFLMQDEDDVVGEGLVSSPSSSPNSRLDEDDVVGADVHPWPRSPRANLDVQRDAMNFGSALHGFSGHRDTSPLRSFSPTQKSVEERGEEGRDKQQPVRSHVNQEMPMVEEVRDEHQPLRRSVLDNPPARVVEYTAGQRTQPRSDVLSYHDNPWAASSTGETASRQEAIVPSKQWPTMPPEANQTRSRRDLSAWTSDAYSQMRWPSLPEEEATDHQSWEIMRRSWERQQRLNEEQRGVSWNA